MAIKERIAIIDDDNNLRRTMADILAYYGYEPVVYPNGQSAKAEIVQARVGVALLDLRLEDCSGLEIMSFIREKSPDTTCIILTGHASQDSAIDAINAGAYSYILKPVNIEQLLVTIRRALEKRQSDMALLESKRQYQALAEASPVGIFRTDAQGHTTYVNPYWSLMSDMPFEAGLGMDWLDAVHPEDRQRLLAGWQTANSIQKASQAEFRFLRPDGDIVWVIGQSLPEYDSAGQFIGCIGTITDITTSKKNEAAIKRYVADLEVLYKNGLKLARLFEKQDIAQCIITLLEEQLHWHHAVLRLYDPQQELLNVLGFSSTDLAADQAPSQLQQVPVPALKPGQGLTGWAWQHNQTVRCGNLAADARYHESISGMKSGLYVPLQAADRVSGVISVESEIPDAFTDADERLLVTLAAQAAAAFENARLYTETAQRMAELNTLVQVSAAMRTAENRAEILPVILAETIRALRVSGAAFASHNAVTAETVFELGAGDLTKYTHTAIPASTGITSWVIQHSQPYICQDLDNDPQYHPPVMVAQPPKAMAIVPLISQNQTIGALLVGSQTFIEQNQLNLLQTIANIAANAIRRAALYEQTVSYATELEQRVADRTAELSAANTALEKASRLKDEFLASMSHELRTPLTGILGLSESLQLLTYGELNPRQLNALKNIEDSGRHLLALINDILDLSKIEAGKLDLQFASFSVAEICQASLQLVKGMAHQKHQTVQFSMNPAAISIYADARRLKQMLVNLLSNAVKFTPENGALGLDVELNKADQQLILKVWDKGIGIAPENQVKLFKPFVQLDGSLSRAYTGTGLGLSLVHRMAELHGGKVRVESALGEGSTFSIYLPWSGSANQPAGTLTQAISTSPANQGMAAREHAQEPLVMIADDNNITLEIVSDYLNDKGYRVVTTHNGLEFLDRAAEISPDLVLVDIQMPGLDGFETIHRLRANPDPVIASVPIIAVTALAMPGDRDKCLQAGANDYLSKPISLIKLVEMIGRLLKENKK